MNDADEIRRLVALFAFHIDNRDFEALTPILSEHCLIESPGEFRLSGRETTIAAMSDNRPPEPVRHLLGPTVVQIAEREHAAAWTDLMVVIPGDAGPQQILGTWRYHDRLALIDQKWVFTHRILRKPLPGVAAC